jgi:hypothetical protein
MLEIKFAEFSQQKLEKKCNGTISGVLSLLIVKRIGL